MECLFEFVECGTVSGGVGRRYERGRNEKERRDGLERERGGSWCVVISSFMLVEEIKWMGTTWRGGGQDLPWASYHIAILRGLRNVTPAEWIIYHKKQLQLR